MSVKTNLNPRKIKVFTDVLEYHFLQLQGSVAKSQLSLIGRGTQLQKILKTWFHSDTTLVDNGSPLMMQHLVILNLQISLNYLLAWSP